MRAALGARAVMADATRSLKRVGARDAPDRVSDLCPVNRTLLSAKRTRDTQLMGQELLGWGPRRN